MEMKEDTKMRFRALPYIAALSVLLPVFGAGTAHASANGRKNTTIALGALTVHQALQGKTTNALVLGAGTAYAYKRYNDARKSEKRRATARRYYQQRQVTRSYRR
jgi:hypothetical protein